MPESGHRWDSDCTDTVERKIRGGHHERALRGRAGEVVAQRTGAICRATVDGAVWITHLKRRDTPQERFFKLPATHALALAGCECDVPELPVNPDARLPAGHTYREIRYEECAGVGYLHFDFYNGAMSTEQCERLHDAYVYARSRRQTRVIALMGGSDFFSNGIHLNVIEAAPDPATESWRNLNAINDVVREIIQTDSHAVISALGGDAAAGGVPLALAADYVVAREDVVLNPYYQHMGGLYGSEYLDLPAAPSGRGRDDRTARRRAICDRRYSRGRRDRAPGRRVRRHPRDLPRPHPTRGRAPRARRRSAAAARAQALAAGAR